MRQKLVCVGVLIALLTVCGAGNAQLKKLRTGTTVGELKSINPAKNKRDTEIDVLAPGEDKARRYTVGAQQKEIVAAVKAAKIGDRVEIEWYDTVEGLCVDKFQVLGAKPKNEKKTGSLAGVITDKGNSKNMNNAWIEIKADGEEDSKGRRYWPAADAKKGGPNGEILAAIRAVAVGSRVRIEWIDAGDGKDITKFEVLKAK